MLRQIIILGAGSDGREALDFFGSQHVFCFADNDSTIVGQYIKDKRILSFGELEQIFNGESLIAAICFEIVIAVSKTRWAMFSLANQLKKSGITNFSVFQDIKRRWSCGKEFIERDRTLYPCEQESIVEIYQCQLDYMLRHTDPSLMLPAIGKLRQSQLFRVEQVHTFFKKVDSLKIFPFMVSGTLVGAIRHKGFIPWDDDMDFGILNEEYKRLLAYCEKETKVFYHVGNDVWKAKEGEISCPSSYQYFAAVGFGYMQIYYNTGAFYPKENLLLCDLFPLYFFQDGYTKEMFAREHEKFLKMRKRNFDLVDLWQQQADCGSKYSPHECGKIGYGHDLTSALAYWHGINGRKFDRKIWDTKDLLPLKVKIFEGYEFWSPKNEKQWLNQEYDEDPMKLPSRVGVYVHDKERIFTDIY